MRDVHDGVETLKLEKSVGIGIHTGIVGAYLLDAETTFRDGGEMTSYMYCSW